VAGYLSILANVSELRGIGLANFFHVLTSGMETATTRWVDRARHLPG